MSVDHFEYRDLALTVDRGAIGQPSTVTLDWFVVDDDGQEHDRKLVLGCELLIDTVESVRELSVVSISGDSDAVADFRRYVMLYEGHILNDGDYDNERMLEVAEGLGRALLLQDAKERCPTLFFKVIP